jgi:hypothetical protein
LTRGAVPALEQILHRLELADGIEVLGVLAHPVEEATHQLPGRHPIGMRKIDQLAFETVAGRQPLVLVEHLERVTRKPLSLFEMHREFADQGLHKRREPDRMFHVRL